MKKTLKTKKQIIVAPSASASSRASPSKKIKKITAKTSTPLFPSLLPETTTQKTSAKSSRSPKVKHSPIDYYNCLLIHAQQGFYDPLTGQKKKVTACCRDCKSSAPALNNQRDQELVKLITSYRQVGDSLAKLLQPVK